MLSTVPSLGLFVAFIYFVSCFSSWIYWIPPAILVLPWLKIMSFYLWDFVREKCINSTRLESHGKAVLITGCDTGFGHLFAKRFESLGYTVFACCLDPSSEDSERLAYSQHIIRLKLDVTKDDDMTHCLTQVEQRLENKKLWAVIANAGIEKHGYFEWLKMSDFQRLFDVNVFGVIRTVHTFLPLMRQGKEGRIVIMSSFSGEHSSPTQVAYGMTKFAVKALAQGLRRELCQFGIHASSIAPFVFRTELVSCLDTNELNKLYENLNEEKRNFYGEKSLNYVKTIEDLVVKYANERLSIVTNAVEHAVTVRFPRPTYLCDNPIDTLSAKVIGLLPEEELDMMYLYVKFYLLIRTTIKRWLQKKQDF